MTTTIFVSIVSYRDPECQPTIEDLFATASHPRRIHVAAVCQCVPSDGMCLRRHRRRSGVLVHHIDAGESKGVCWARAKAQSFFGGEDYYLQVDSHTRFIAGWDEWLVKAIEERRPEHATVVSTYPSGYTPPRTITRQAAYGIVAKRFNEQGVLMLGSRSVANRSSSSKLLPGAFVGACFLFGPGSIVTNVPYDPNIYFFGEEIALSARLWTSGYDIFHPTSPIAFHLWDRSYRRLHSSDHGRYLVDGASSARVRDLLGREQRTLRIMGGLGLGDTRSIREYESYCGVDFSDKIISTRATLGQFEDPNLVYEAPWSQDFSFPADGD